MSNPQLCTHTNINPIGHDGTRWCIDCGSIAQPTLETPRDKWVWRSPNFRPHNVLDTIDIYLDRQQEGMRLLGETKLRRYIDKLRKKLKTMTAANWYWGMD